MRPARIFLGLLLLSLTGCGVDPRWGPRNGTNQALPGTFGVDARWGEPRTGLRKPLEWQYQSLPRKSPEGIE